jgi:hypothetical protein
MEVTNGQTSRHDVTRASYPIPQPLTERLRRAASALTAGGDESTVQTDSIPQALAELIQNSLEAMDQMYFQRSVSHAIELVILVVELIKMYVSHWLNLFLSRSRFQPTVVTTTRMFPAPPVHESSGRCGRTNSHFDRSGSWNDQGRSHQYTGNWKATASTVIGSPCQGE